MARMSWGGGGKNHQGMAAAPPVLVVFWETLSRGMRKRCRGAGGAAAGPRGQGWVLPWVPAEPPHAAPSCTAWPTEGHGLGSMSSMARTSPLRISSGDAAWLLGGGKGASGAVPCPCHPVLSCARGWLAPGGSCSGCPWCSTWQGSASSLRMGRPGHSPCSSETPSVGKGWETMGGPAPGLPAPKGASPSLHRAGSAGTIIQHFDFGF